VTKVGVTVFEDSSSLEAFGVGTWEEVGSGAVSENGAFRVALSGGRTPGGLYAAIAGHRDGPPWPGTHVFQVDERFVPSTDDDSNLRLLRRTLLDRVPIPEDHIHAVDTSLPGPEQAASKYEDDLVRHFGLRPGAFPRFDLILLGLGSDGHTASLFPGSEALGETRRLARAVRGGRPLLDRVTLTLPVINNARRILFVVLGRGKASVLKEMIEAPESSLPAARVEPPRGEVLVLADRQAASRLSEGSYSVFSPDKRGGPFSGPGSVRP
jgi:6-phosphogluconolactonase